MPKYHDFLRFPLPNFSALWDIKLSTENRDMPPLVHKFFSIPGSFWERKGFPYRPLRFGPVRQKYSIKSWYPLSLMHNFFQYLNFSETPKCSLTKFFGTVRQKVFNEETWYPPSLMHKIFQYLIFSDTPKCSPTKFFGTLRQKSLNEMSLLHKI